MQSVSDWPEKIRAFAQQSGFDLCGVARVADLPELEHFSDWVAQGRAGEMEYLKSRNDQGEFKRAALHNVAPWARSVVICALNYNTAQPYSTEITDSTKGWISRYAWFGNGEGAPATDYHDAALARLRQVEAAFHQWWGSQNDAAPLQTRCYVDTGPLVERVYAKYAGVGWIAKNTCVINQELGSWLFLGSILTSADLTQEDSMKLPAEDRCGSCTRCLEACPTGALTAPYQMDASLCISYLTIEKRGSIPEDLRHQMGHQVFGCDICQDVCPWNDKHRELVTSATEFQARRELVSPDLQWLAKMDRDEFNKAFRGSPIKRAKFEGMRRNVAIAMGNSGDESFIPLLQEMDQDENVIVADHARWALNRLKEQDG